MENLAVNKVGSYRKDTLAGRNHYVVPMTMIVPGVLNGSKGALYYPPEEISKNYDAWNGIPLTVYHPTENGQAVSARSPQILNKYKIGEVLNARINNQGKLVAEAWIDIERAREIDSRVLNSLENGIAIELSTGLFTDNIPAQNGANHKGKGYQYIARNYRPDHLAILPDQVGACSLKDGCGIGVQNARAKNRCWKGYKPTPGKKPYSKGSCEPTSNFETAISIVLNASSMSKTSLDMSVDKACKILKDKSVRGHKLSNKQRGMFGAKCGERVTNQAIEILLNKWSPEAIAASAAARRKGKAAVVGIKSAGKAVGKAGLAIGKDVLRSMLQRIKDRLGIKSKAQSAPNKPKPQSKSASISAGEKARRQRVHDRQVKLTQKLAKHKASMLMKKSMQKSAAKKAASKLKAPSSKKANPTKSGKKSVKKSSATRKVKKMKS